MLHPVTFRTSNGRCVQCRSACAPYGDGRATTAAGSMIDVGAPTLARA
jgi:hypothetical protein